MDFKKTELEKNLKKLSADEIEIIFSACQICVLSNMDVVIALENNQNPFADDEATIKEIEEFAKGASEKLRKTDKIKRLSSALSLGTVREMFALEREIMVEAYELLDGIPCIHSCFEEIEADPVFQKRKEFLNCLNRVMKGALTLYGYICLDQFIKLIERYEPWMLKEADGYERAQGNAYASTSFMKTGRNWTKWANAYFLLHATVSGIWDEESYIHPVYTVYADSAGCSFAMLSQIMEDGYFAEEDYFPGYTDPSYLMLDVDIHRGYFHVLKKKDFLPYMEGTGKRTAAVRAFLSFMKRYSMMVSCNPDRNKTEERLLAELQAIYCSSGFFDEGADGLAPLYEDILEFFSDYDVSCSESEILEEGIRHILAVYNEIRLWSLRGHTRKESGEAAIPLSYAHDMVEEFFDLYYDDFYDYDEYDDCDFSDPDDPDDPEDLAEFDRIISSMLDELSMLSEEPDFAELERRNIPVIGKKRKK